MKITPPPTKEAQGNTQQKTTKPKSVNTKRATGSNSTTSNSKITSSNNATSNSKTISSNSTIRHKNINSSNSSARNSNITNSKSIAKTNNTTRNILLVIIILLLAFVIYLLLSTRNANRDDINLNRPEFETAVDTGVEGIAGEKPVTDGVNLAVMPDFTVTSDNPDFVIPYPENAYDAEFAFVDENGQERYRTRRVRPGTAVTIPAYRFCDEGEHPYRVRVSVYDTRTYKEVPGAVALEMKIIKKETNTTRHGTKGKSDGQQRSE